ncbi:hypothetical protein DP939_02410 [Spongiactinospora rosea]|uniref:Uncharacterized protein n=1 Tax=Spongiactinospora rosea TaxID=2248750 RepID=A0A366M7K9_9ACTN|nr:hypothetical protein [Spongiactinospora rosea]RBQ21584.1 hypothetical protein DP939_02410 [Spongiactinospora rosea]
MEDHDPLAWLGALLMSAYATLGKFMWSLPVPTGLPVPEGPDGPDAVEAITRARAALRDQPMDDITRSMIDRMCLEWLTVLDLGAVVRMAGPDPWRLEAMSYGIDRFFALAEVVGPRLEE